MIDWIVPEPLMWALRWGLLLAPLAAIWGVMQVRSVSPREYTGALFAFLYGIGMVVVMNQVALWFGWWAYGWNTLMLDKLPADIMIGGAILFGPALFLAFPRIKPFWICVPLILLVHGTIFSSLSPLVVAGPNWFVGVLVVFASAHIPAIYLARWTAKDTHLPRRVALLVIMFGANAFVVLPALIMEAMGGNWDLAQKSIGAWALFLPSFAFACLIGVAAAQTLALQGLGTAIPLDPTKRLVRTGIYAYLSNPMQLSAALGWILIGAFLSNIWIALAALMAWVFVQGIVRWHHRGDLLARYPEGWPAYCAHVPEWWPRWKPWGRVTAHLHLDPKQRHHQRLASFLAKATALNLVWDAKGSAAYQNPDNVRPFNGAAALAVGLTHRNFFTALAGHAALLAILGASYLCLSLRSWR